MEQRKGRRPKTTRRLEAKQGVNVLAEFTRLIDRMDVPSLTELMVPHGAPRIRRGRVCAFSCTRAAA